MNWINAWNRLAEQCNQFLVKGRLVYAEGRLHTRVWEGQDSQQHSRVEVIANNVVFLDRRTADAPPEDPDRQMADAPPEDKVNEAGSAELEPDDIPF